MSKRVNIPLYIGVPAVAGVFIGQLLKHGHYWIAGGIFAAAAAISFIPLWIASRNLK